MPDFTIDDFWRHRLAIPHAAQPKSLPGWEAGIPTLDTFVEAPLSRSSNFDGDNDPNDSPVILVSAPGAVGKSTLARQIASLTGAVYLDLAKAEPVGGNTLSGGLVKSGLLNDWLAGAAALLIDGLDEARLKVTQEGFEAFLADIAYLCGSRSIPTVLFGRTGAIQDTWLFLEDKMNVAVLEIGFYPAAIAERFAQARLHAANPENAHLQAGYRALSTLLERLRQDTQNDGDRFAGYAPVLQAVAERVSKESNPSILISQVEKGEQPVTLQAVISAILLREQQKLQTLNFEDAGLKQALYHPGEQLQRLISRVYHLAPPPLPPMSPSDTQTYSSALETWVPEHPFLDGAITAASAVFDAVITGAALRDPKTANQAATRELAKGAAANPFLAEFYFGSSDNQYIPPEHVGLIYTSLRARLSIGDSASLSIDGIEDGDEVQQLEAEIEIAISRNGEDQVRTLSFKSDQAGIIRLGSHVEDVDISAPFAHVEVGSGRESVLVSPVSIQCQKITFSAERIIIEASPTMVESAVSLEAETAETSAVTSVPVLNGKVTFSVYWQGAEVYPWTNFRGNPSVSGNPKTDEALRRFRKFIISFRSHSKGSLKRYAAKLEHERMTKGTGRAVLSHMVATGLLSTDGSMYTLHPDKLAQTGSSYSAAMSSTFTDKTISYVNEALPKA
ncbi:hypothetical protein [Sphingomonas abaci]|uniref:Uncharacterized protein n=1 Tax=Sphingomonas abaci TaxID=237611 RepID=A0A7W7APQ7_9SPHN|nr:hypothetical protein [Sphingomonas abaci]MBB4620025.1 hypothetical protein [Sphingomonas abaci]